MTTLTHRHKRQLQRHPERRAVLTVEQFTRGADRIDRDHKVIRGVKVVGLRSRNPARVIGVNSDAPFYAYSLEALRAAATLYEGVGVYIDHPNFSYAPDGSRRAATGDRKVADRFGRLVNVTVTDDGLYADLEYLASHPRAEMVLEAAERMPEQIALSHNAITVPKVRPDGTVVIEEIVEVRSVDLIGEKPGTTSSLFESGSDSEPAEDTAVKKTAKQILEACGPAAKGKAHLASILEMDGMDSLGESPVDMPAEASADDQMKAAFRAMVMAAVDDDSLDTAATVARIKEILTAQEKLMSGEVAAPVAEADEDEEEMPVKPDDEKPTAESAATVKLQKELAEFKARDNARELIESHNADLAKRNLPPIETSGVRIKAVAALESEADRKALIKTWETAAPAPKPRSASPFGRDVPAHAKPATDGASLAARVKF